MSELVTREEQAVADAALVPVLANSLYPGAKPESVALVIAYCHAAHLDPLQKPVHIVPMSVKTGRKDARGYDEKEMRDTIMPGIGLYRTQAARTGQYAGQDEPKFGPDKTLDYFKSVWIEKQKKSVKASITYPEWCSVTIYRLVGGFRSAFTAIERWTENYATAGRESDAPNEMWARRSYAQLAKCAEAQALRKAFPEVGSQPTADEMEGRDHEPPEAPDYTPAAAPVTPQRMSDKTPEEPVIEDAKVVDQAAKVEGPSTAAASPPPAPAQPAPPPAADATGEPATDGEKANIRVVAKARGVDLLAVLARLSIAVPADTLAGLTKSQFKLLKGELK